MILSSTTRRTRKGCNGFRFLAVLAMSSVKPAAARKACTSASRLTLGLAGLTLHQIAVMWLARRPLLTTQSFGTT